MRGRMSSRKDPGSQDVYPWGIVPACRGGILPCADNAPGYTHRICGDRCAPWRCAPNVGSHRASYVHWHLLGFSAGPPSAVRLMLRARHISSRVRRHTCKCRAHGQACTSFHGTPPPILPRICSRTAGGFLSVPPGRGDTRPKQSTASRFPCEGDDTRVEPRRRLEGGQVWTKKIVIWAAGPPSTTVTDCRALLQTRISASAHHAAVRYCRRS